MKKNVETFLKRFRTTTYIRILFLLFILLVGPSLWAQSDPDLCREPDVLSVSITHSWPNVCGTRGDCWREITMFTDGALEFSDNDGFIQGGMSEPSLVELMDIIENSSFIAYLDNPLAAECKMSDGINDVAIEVTLDNGAVLYTRWAGGCRNIEGHPYKAINDLAIQQRIDHVPCDTFDSPLDNEDFDYFDHETLNDFIVEYHEESVHGLCFPCGGKC